MQFQSIKSGERSLVQEQTGISNEIDIEGTNTPLVSFLSEVPEPIQAAMTVFIENHPNWDQYRLIQAAIAGFLVQNGVESRSITRLYLDKMFCSRSFGQDF